MIKEIDDKLVIEYVECFIECFSLELGGKRGAVG